MASKSVINAIDAHDIEAWRPYAKCLDMTQLFYSDRGNGSFVDNQRAKSICLGNETPEANPCPVREHCLEYALTHRERHGVWGGATERERRSMVRRRLAG